MAKFGGIDSGTLDLTTLNASVVIDIADWRIVQLRATGGGSWGSARVAFECSGDNGINWDPVIDAASAAVIFAMEGLEPRPIEIGVMKCRARVSVLDAGAGTTTMWFNLKK